MNEPKTDPPPDPMIAALGEILAQGARQTEILGVLARQVASVDNRLAGAVRAFTTEHADRGIDAHRVHRSLDMLAHELRRALDRLDGGKHAADEHRETLHAKRNGPYGG